MPGDRLARWWSTDVEVIFARVALKCACGGHATAMRVTRATRDARETLLAISTRGEYHG